MGTLAMNLTKNDLASRAEGALLGAALGDAAGWPQEPAGRRAGMRPDASGPLLAPWHRRAGGRFLSYLEPIAAGEYSDDTQLIIATARSLLKPDWWRYLTQVELPTWTIYERGGGGATKRAAARWLRGASAWTGPLNDVERHLDAGGNGVAMRVLPHVIAGADGPFEAIATAVFENGIATHGHPRALIGALLHAAVLYRAFRQDQTLSYGGLIDDVREWKAAWSAIPDSARIREWLRATEGVAPRPFKEHWTSTVDEVDRLLEVARQAINEGTLAVDANVLNALGATSRDSSGSGTVSAVAALFLASRFAAEPMLAVRQAAFAPSADTDTVASMTGSILGALYGTEWVRPATAQLQDVEYVASFAAELVNRVVSESNPVDRVTEASVKRAEHALASAQEGDSWELPDGRAGTVTKVIILKTQTPRAKPVMYVVRLADGQTIHVIKASREKSSPEQTSSIGSPRGGFNSTQMAVTSSRATMDIREGSAPRRPPSPAFGAFRVPDLALNAFPVEFSSNRVEAWVRPFDHEEDLTALRNDAAGVWEYRRHGDDLYTFRIGPSAPEPPGDRIEVVIAQNLGLVAGLLPRALTARLRNYEPIRRRPFRFRGQRNNLMEGIAQRVGVRHMIMDHLDVAPRYELDGRVLEVSDGNPQVVITVGLSTDWRLTGSVGELARLDVPVAGHFVIWSEPRVDGRRLAGRLLTISGDRATVLINETDVKEIACDRLVLEPSRHTVAQILAETLGDCATSVRTAIDERIGDLLQGPALLDQVRYVGSVIAKSPLSVADGLTCTVSSLVSLPRVLNGASVTAGRPVNYCFDPSRTKRDSYAWRGLERYGPFSGDTFARRSPTILVVHPEDAKGQVETFIQALRDGIHGPGFNAYQKGLARTFGLTNPRFIFTPVAFNSGGQPAEAYARAIADALAMHPALPDAAIVVVRDQDARLADPQNPYLHSKAVLLMAGVPVQEIRLSTATRNHAGLQYVLQNVAVALYAKMNGIPWTVDHDLTIADEIVIGIGTAELLETRLAHRQRYVGVTTVFRGDGNYLLGHLSRECSYDEYPEVLRESTTAVLSEIKVRNAWQPQDTIRIVIHSPRPPRNVDVARVMADVVAAVGDQQEIEFAFVQVSHDHPYVIFDEGEQGQRVGSQRKGIMAPDRGLIMQTGPRSRLLCTVGPQLVKRPGMGIPHPLQIHLHRASTFTDMVYLTEQVLKFTSLTWRSTLPAAEPVTIYYSELIARLLGRLRNVPGWSPATLSSRLRTSKWFL